MTIAADNASYNTPVHFVQGGAHLRVVTGDGLAATPTTGLIGSVDQLWGDAPLISYWLDQTLAILYDEPFVTYDATNDWTLTQATSGSAAISTTVPGALTLNPGGTTAHHGAQIQRKTAMFLPASGKSIWFEAIVEMGAGLTGELFIGLADVDTTLIAAGSLHATDCIGFSSVTGDGVMLFNCNNASVGNTPDPSPVTLSTTVAHALGFFYDGVAQTVQAYVDGVAVGNPVAVTYIPTVAVYPSIVCQTTGTTQSTLTISALRVLQLR